jgi:hypothetical protein
MAIRTDDLTARDFGLDPRKRIALMHQRGDPGGLSCNVVELQDKRVYKPAVGATRRREKAEDVLPRFRPSAFACRAGLTAVQFSALAHVGRATLLAPGLPLVEIGRGQVFFASSTAPHSGRHDWWRRWNGGCRGRRTDATRPNACRAERDSEFARDRSQGPSLGAKSPGLTLLASLPRRHTNICSITGRT